MKILTTISYFRPYVSGLTVCVQRMVDGLAERGFEFTVLTSRHNKSLSRMEKKDKIVILRQAVIFTVGKVPVMPGYLKTLIDQIRRVDLVWIHLPQAEGLITAIAAKLFGKRIVVTLHCLPLLPSGWQRALFQKLFDLLNNLTIWLTDKVVYYTKDYAENTPELWHFPGKSKYILPPIPSATFNRFNHSSHFSHSLYTIGFAGRVAEDKGLEYLISALQLMKGGGKDARLIIAGSREAIGESRYTKKIYSLIDESGVQIEFLGVVEPEKMADFYKSIDVLVLPSVNRTEAFGMVQAEAMKCGIPVIAANLPGVRVPIELTGAGRIAAAKNPAALAEAIDFICRRPWDGNKISRPARRIFSPRQTFSQYTQVFRDG